MDEGSVDVVGVSVRVAQTHVVNLGELADGSPQTRDSVSTSPLYVELLDDLVEGAKDLHVAELRIAVQVFVLSLILGRPVRSEQVLQSKAHAADLLGNVRLRLLRFDVAVQKVLRNRVHSFLDG